MERGVGMGLNLAASGWSACGITLAATDQALGHQCCLA